MNSDQEEDGSDDNPDLDLLDQEEVHPHPGQNMIVDALCLAEIMEDFSKFGFSSGGFEDVKHDVIWDNTLDCYIVELFVTLHQKETFNIEDLQKMISFAKNKRMTLDVGVAEFDSNQDDFPSMEATLKGYVKKLVGRGEA